MSWWTEPAYSAIEVLIIIVLSALPMSQIAAILLGILQEKTGIKLKHSYGSDTTIKSTENNNE